ncbi:putative BTB/POZ domain-containing protein [Acanthamoeba polyphaga mimivirus]|uniref:BTB/POZ domain-containing protein n=1 Tax=Acanthamoeba polyphaga mimivirus Kroon TaxID=3069720 RepID=A0A0G2Y217_9VIRU|nr:putative BTB/POZ domain-containing protein [Acanthamoeba polyphaga mimivirus]AKI79775.1 putative BTB/POZ domain-containing protein [Acanthamoeba polyphaga mimivirus Kroon]
MELENITEKLSAIEILLHDVHSDNLVSLILDKNVLCEKCPFFSKMFKGFKEQFEKVIVVKVPYVDITSIILKNFHGHKIEISDDWKSQIKLYMCYNYLGIKTDFPTKIKVQDYCFDELLDLIELNGYNEQTVKTLVGNLPIDNLEKLPIDFLTVMDQELVDFDIIATDSNGVVSEVDCTINTSKKIYEQSNCNFHVQYFEKTQKLMVLSSDNVSTGDNQNTVYMYEYNYKTDTYELKDKQLMTGKKNNRQIGGDRLEDEQQIIGKIYFMKCSPEEDKLTFVILNSGKNKLVTYDLDKNTYHEVIRRNDITEICYSSNNKTLHIEKNNSTYSIYYNGILIFSENNILRYICHVNNDVIVFNEYCANQKLNFVKTTIIPYYGSDFFRPIKNGSFGFSDDKIIYGTENNITDIKYKSDYILIVSAKTIMVYSIFRSSVIKEIYCEATNIKFIDRDRVIAYGINCPTNIYNISTGEKIKNIDYPNIKELFVLNNVKNYALKQRIKAILNSRSLKKVI